MKKEDAPYSRTLGFFSILNPSLFALCLMFSFNLPLTQNYLRAFLFCFLSLVPMLVIKIVSEKTDRKIIRYAVSLALILLSLAVPGEVMRPSWIIMLTIFSFVFVFCPHIEGRTMMSEAHIWDIIPLFASYILSQILNNTIMITADTLLILTFILEYMLTRNMKGVMIEVKSRECRVSRTGIIRENRKIVIFFIAVYLVLCVLVPVAVNLLSNDREESTVSYTFGEAEEGEEEVKTPIEAKEIRLSKKSDVIDFSPLGNILLYLFLALIAGGIILSVIAVLMRLFSVVNTGKKRRSSALSDETILESDITDTRKEKVKEKDNQVFLSPRWRIRHLYRAFVLSKEDSRAKLRTMTTGEIGSVDDIPGELTEIYNRTRYTEESVGKESVRRMQILVKENKKSSK